MTDGSRRRWAGVGTGADHLDDVGDRRVEGYPVALRAVPVPERDGTGGHVVVARDRHERDLLLLRGTDLLLHPLVGLVDLDPDALGAQPVGEVAQVTGVVVADRDADHLYRR